MELAFQYHKTSERSADLHVADMATLDTMALPQTLDR